MNTISTYPVWFLLTLLTLLIGQQSHAAHFPPLEEETPITTTGNQSVKGQPTAQRPAAGTERADDTSGYLGMGVDFLPATVRAHLPDSVAPDQGVIVTRFADEPPLDNGSPAADDGVKQYDVIIAYNDKPVKRPDELINLIHNDTPGQVVTLTLVRQGEIIKVPVTLGKPTLNKRPGRASGASATASQYPQQPAHFGTPSKAPLVSMAPTNWMSNAMPKMPSLQPYGTNKPRPQLQPRPVYPTPRPMLSYQNGRVQYAGKSYPMLKQIKKKKHAWGDERHIWPDFYTKMTNDMWDSMINGPFDMGRMPGGWRAPSLSSPDPVTIGDAVTNQIPPMVEEMGKMTDFSNKK